MDWLDTLVRFFQLMLETDAIWTLKPWVSHLLIMPLVTLIFYMTRYKTTQTLKLKFGPAINVIGFIYTMFVVVAMPVMTISTTWDLMRTQNNSMVDIVATIMVTILYWSVFFHLLAFLMGAAFTHFVGPNWVRCIDYFYLIGSTFGILRVAAGNASVTTDLGSVNAVGVVVLGIALSLRLTKTSIEIFQWDKLSKQEILERQKEKLRLGR